MTIYARYDGQKEMMVEFKVLIRTKLIKHHFINAQHSQNKKKDWLKNCVQKMKQNFSQTKGSPQNS